jgi:hypothetical protein
MCCFIASADRKHTAEKWATSLPALLDAFHQWPLAAPPCISRMSLYLPLAARATVSFCAKHPPPPEAATEKSMLL